MDISRRDLGNAAYETESRKNVFVYQRYNADE
jgi:hypothetical protein